jgi:cytoskeletal protein RodZ
MPRYDDDDDDDDRPRRRRRDEDDDDDRPRRSRRRREEPKSNTGLILGIVGGVLLVVLSVCGFGIWKFTQGVKKIGDQVKVQMEEAEAEGRAGSTATQFLKHLSTEQAQTAYDTTTPAFRAKFTKPQFDELLKKHPLLTTHKDHEEHGFSSVTGTTPNRQRRIQYSLSSVPIDNLDEDFDDEDNPRPKVKPKQKQAGQRLTITLVVVETADKQWKVNELTVP